METKQKFQTASCAAFRIRTVYFQKCHQFRTHKSTSPIFNGRREKSFSKTFQHFESQQFIFYRLEYK